MAQEHPSGVWGRPGGHRAQTAGFLTMRSDLLGDAEVGAVDSQATEPPGDFDAVASSKGEMDDTSDVIPEVVAERYERRAMLGRGGMGKVWQCWDRHLQRPVALKVLRAKRIRPNTLTQFEEEAMISARLQHPGIIPIHDVGRLEDGRPWFAMKEVQGSTLEALLAEVHSADGATLVDRGPVMFRRLLGSFLRVCEAVAYAHAQGIVHRDLKPSNVMVGSFGEILVVDWGLATLVADDAGSAEPTGRVLIAGTPAYMAPEQARGQSASVGAPADVHALGAILYDLLAGRPPRMAGSALQLVQLVAKAERVPPPSVVSAWTHSLDDQLDRICLRALEPDPDDRYPDAEALAQDLSQWLDGAKKRERALDLVQQADKATAEARQAEDRCAGVSRRADALLADLAASAPDEDKMPGWVLQDEATRLRSLAHASRTRVVQLLRSALSHDPDLSEAHERLADHFMQQHRILEVAGDTLQARAALADLDQHDRSGRHQPYVTGTGALSLVTDPPGAEARLHRYVEEGRRMVPRFERTLGTTPLRAVPLAMGSYLLTLHRQGHVDVRYPVLIRREEHWDGVPPGETEPFVIGLPVEGALGPEDCYVPAGWFWAGDDELQTTLPLQRRWMHPFVARKFPVTNEAYAEFLNDLLARGREDLALQRELLMAEEGGPYFHRDASGRWVGVRTDHEGPIWSALHGVPHLPAVYVTLADATAYAAWEAQRSGLPWTLPTEVEWQRAARGADQRSYPWGDHFEPTWSRCMPPHGVQPHIMGVNSFPTDVSPFGLRGMAGNVLDLVTGEDGDCLRMGGSCSSGPLTCRLTYRVKQLPTGRIGRVGFRIVRGLL